MNTKIDQAIIADKYSPNILHIKHESFLNTPETMLKNLSSFLGLKYDQDLSSSISAKIDSSRSYAFLSKEKLLCVYDTVKNQLFINQLGYSSLT